MCEHCAGFETERFFSLEDFAAFEKAFEKKLLDGTFVRVVNSSQLAQNSYETTYQCTYCGTYWVLSPPEGEWQGYFLPEDQLADDYEQVEAHTFQVDSKKNNNSCGCCLGMFLLLIGLIVYGIYSIFDFIIDFLF
jgi:hypothetical protein